VDLLLEDPSRGVEGPMASILIGNREVSVGFGEKLLRTYSFEVPVDNTVGVEIAKSLYNFMELGVIWG